jgi:predicted PurR-regulated permease PerM
MNNPMELSNRTIWRVLIITSVYVGLLYLAYHLRRELTWIGAAAFLAMALYPTVESIARWMPRKSRALAAGLVFLSSLLLVSFVIMALTPPLVRQTQGLVHDLPRYADRLDHSHNVVVVYIKEQGWLDDLRSNQSQLLSHLSGITSSAPDLLRGIFSSIAALLTTLVLTFFVLMEGPGWLEAFWQYHPPSKREHRKRLAAEMYQTVTGYVNGNLLTSLVAAVATSVTLAVVGVPFAVPLGILVGIIDLIPLVGATIAAIIIVLMTLLYGSPTKALIMVIYFVIYQQLENHILQPLVYSRTVKLSPLTVVVAGLFGAVLAGLLGALVAIPVAASIQILVRDYFENHFNNKT